MKIKRGIDDRVFHFEFVSFGRGRWAVNLISVDGSRVIHGMGDPDYPNERAARAAAREMVGKYKYYKGLGWCVDSEE